MDLFWIQSTCQSSDGRGRNVRLKEATIRSTKKPWGNLYVLPNICVPITYFSQLFDDLASWRGEIKKAASNAVRAHYDLFPHKDSNLSKAETRDHVKQSATNLIKQSSFAHGSKDEEVCAHFFLSIHFIHLLEGPHGQLRSSSHP